MPTFIRHIKTTIQQHIIPVLPGIHLKSELVKQHIWFEFKICFSAIISARKIMLETAENYRNILPSISILNLKLRILFLNNITLNISRRGFSKPRIILPYFIGHLSYCLLKRGSSRKRTHAISGIQQAVTAIVFPYTFYFHLPYPFFTFSEAPAKSFIQIPFQKPPDLRSRLGSDKIVALL